MNRVVVAHRGKGFRKSTLLLWVKIGPGREHAMVVGRRGPYLTKAAFGHEALAANRVPERAADCAGIGSPVEDGAHHFHFAGPGIAMLAEIAVESQREVVPTLDHALLL